MKGGMHRSTLNPNNQIDLGPPELTPTDFFPKKVHCIECDNKEVPFIENDPHRTAYYSCDKCNASGDPFNWCETLNRYRKLAKNQV